MTYDDFRADLKSAGVTLRQFAIQCGLAYSTVAYWDKPRPGSGIAPVPKWAGLLLHAWIQFPELLPVEHQPRAAEASRKASSCPGRNRR